ncbi:MAG: TonB-dependent receptor [Chromatiaceae bacterium]|nr:TonB-dependent receptor [Chromatiaceae bacterium]
MTLHYTALSNIALLISLCCCGVLRAETPPSLEELLQHDIKNEAAAVEVSTSARSIKSVRNSPQATYIISDDDILAFNLKTLAEILSVMPGLYTGSDGTFEYLTTRGIGRPGDYNSRVLFLVDGTRVNDNIYDAGLISDEFYIDTELIERVEYSPGAGSALYGNNAFLGVVNVITKRGNKLRGAELSASADNIDQQRFRASYGLRNAQGHEAWLSFSHRKHANMPIANSSVQRVFQPFIAHNEDDSHKLAATYRYKQLQLQAAAVKRVRQEPGLVDSSLPDAALNKTVSSNYFVALQHSSVLSEDLTTFTNISTNQFSFDSQTPFIVFPGVAAQYLFAVKGKWTNADMRFHYSGFDEHQLLFGVDGQRDHHQRYALSVVDVAPVNSSSGSNSRLGLYFQDEWRIAPTHVMVAGFRYDHTTGGVSELSPKLSWIWQPNAGNTLKLSYGTAFRAPNEYESETNRFYSVSVPESEKVNTTELIWNAQPRANLSYYAALNYSRIENMITSRLGDGVFIDFFNDQPVSTFGLETGVDYLWDFGGRLNMSLSLQEAEYSDGEQLTNSPSQLLKLMYSQPLPWHGWQFNWRSIVAAERKLVNTTLGGYARHDVSVQWQPMLTLDVVLGVKNLTDKRYFEAPRPSGDAYFQAERRAELSVRWRFGQ